MAMAASEPCIYSSLHYRPPAVLAFACKQRMVHYAAFCGNLPAQHEPGMSGGLQKHSISHLLLTDGNGTVWSAHPGRALQGIPTAVAWSGMCFIALLAPFRRWYSHRERLVFFSKLVRLCCTLWPAQILDTHHGGACIHQPPAGAGSGRFGPAPCGVYCQETVKSNSLRPNRGPAPRHRQYPDPRWRPPYSHTLALFCNGSSPLFDAIHNKGCHEDRQATLSRTGNRGVSLLQGDFLLLQDTTE